MRAALCLGAGLLLSACFAHAPRTEPLGPLQEEGELTVYLAALPLEAQRVSFTLSSLGAINDTGLEVPLTLVRRELSFDPGGGERLLARGRLPPGSYGSLVARFEKATLTRPEGPASLLVPSAATPIDVAIKLQRGKAALVMVSLRQARAPDDEVAFTPTFSAVLREPAHTLSQLDGYVSSEVLANLTVFDKHRHEVVATLASGREPQGLALDGRARRLYVALAGQDQVQVIDLATGDEARRVSLQPGDRPRALALSLDGSVLLVVNAGTSTVAFVDPTGGATLARVPVGNEPESVLLDRSGRRAVVFNRTSSDLTVLDLATRSVIGSAATDAEPLRGQFNRAGTRLYVIHGAAQSLGVFSFPELALVSRIYVGPGATALKVDPKTDLIYVANDGESRVQVFDPFSQLPMDWLELPDAASYLAIDDAENALVAIVPSRQAVVFVDLTSRAVLGVVEVGEGARELVLERERY